MADDRNGVHLFSISMLFLCVTYGQIGMSEEICGAANYRVWNLTSEVWRFSLPKASCLVPKGSNTTAGDCVITMAFCRSVNMSNTCSSASVCETTANSTYNLATYVLKRNPFNATGLPLEKGFTTSYKPGEKYTFPNGTVCTLQTMMTFLCNKTAFWTIETSAKVHEVPVKPVVHLKIGTDICTYNITFEFAGACPAFIPRQSLHLSAGSILIMVFIVSVIVYFVMGCFVNIIRGRKGEKLIPHHLFWANLPIYIMDGILFTISCGKTSYKHTYETIR